MPESVNHIRRPWQNLVEGETGKEGALQLFSRSLSHNLNSIAEFRGAKISEPSRPSSPFNKLRGSRLLCANSHLQWCSQDRVSDTHSSDLILPSDYRGLGWVGTLDGTDIAVIAPTGEIYLDSAGYYSLLVLKHMNAILQPMHLRVIATGHVEDGNWQVQDGRSLLRFQDGMRIPPKGLSSSGRAQLVLAAHDKSLVTAANAASTAAAVSAGIAPSPSGQLLSRPGLSAGQNLAPVAAALPAAATTSAAPSPAAIASRLAAVGLTLQDVLALAQSVSAVQPAMGLAALPHSLAGDSNGLVGGMMGSGELGGPSASLGTALPSTQRQPASHTFMSGQAGMSGQMAAASIGTKVAESENQGCVTLAFGASMVPYGTRRFAHPS
ncbi:hypothetical protein QJQ45_005063 [Haematococcus lacustris]|nr:hypothetical protein QJQ45_005063 [Haematococcus lacustris]